MPRLPGPDTEELLARAEDGDDKARQALLARHRARLRQMVAVRLDRRLAARVDPSDVVQETLADADRKLPGFLKDRPVPFYAWLRRIAFERIIKLHERHLAGKRDVRREEPWLPNESALALARRLVPSAASPSRHAIRAEQQARIQTALERLRPRDREVLVLRYLEQLPTRDVAGILDISEGAVKLRLVRALEKLRDQVRDLFEE